MERKNMTIKRPHITMERENMTIERPHITIERENITIERPSTINAIILSLKTSTRPLSY
jgi:hypothetical protein